MGNATPSPPHLWKCSEVHITSPPLSKPPPSPPLDFSRMDKPGLRQKLTFTKKSLLNLMSTLNPLSTQPLLPSQPPSKPLPLSNTPTTPLCNNMPPLHPSNNLPLLPRP